VRGLVEELEKVDVKIFKDGEIEETEIVKIERGLVRDFIPLEKLKDESQADEPAIRITTKNGAFKTIRYYEKPRNRSTLFLMLKMYGELKVGTRVKTQYDKDGNPKIVYYFFNNFLFFIG